MVLSCFYLALALLCGYTRALSIYPASAVVRTHGLVAVACVSYTPPMEDCEFRIRYHDPDRPTKMEPPVFKFKPLEGFETKRVLEANTRRKFYDVKARGNPARPNACAIVLTDVHDGRYLIGCRAKGEEGGPTVRYMALRVDGTSDVLKSTYKDRNMIQTVAFGNESAAIELEPEGARKFSRPCALQGPQKVVQTGASSLNAAGTVCTLPIRADDTARGVLWASAPYSSPTNGSGTELFMKMVTVVGKPKSTTLSVSPAPPDNNPEGGTSSYRDGDTLTATCTAHEADHGARIDWTAGDEALALDGWTAADKSNLDEWTWPWEAKTVEQTISRRFEARDNGTTLKCTARFLNALGQVAETKESDTKQLVQSNVELCLIGNRYARCESEPAGRNEACNATSGGRFFYLTCFLLLVVHQR